MGGVAEALDLVVEGGLGALLGGQHVGDQQSAPRLGDASHFTQDDVRPREVVKRGATSRHVEARVRERNALDVAEYESNVVEAPPFGVGASMPQKHVRTVDADCLAARFRERQREEGRPAGDVENPLLPRHPRHRDEPPERSGIRSRGEPFVSVRLAAELLLDPREWLVCHRGPIHSMGLNRVCSVQTAEVKMYSDYKSPFAYLAFDPGFELEQRYSVRIRWIPFQLRIKGKGERSLYSEHKARYSYLDARRWAKPRGLVIRGPLKVYDTTPALIGGLFAERHGLLKDYSRAAYRKFFERDFEADQPEPVAGLLAELGLCAEEYREYLRGEGASAYQRAQQEAAADHVFGVPLFFFEGEPFWGHDRLPLLEDRLAEAGLKNDG